MSILQREHNPDVNSYIPDVEPGESPGTTDGPEDGSNDIERKPKDDIPVPPDTGRKAPVEEPPGTGGPPVGDVDDSPKRIV